MAGLCAPLSTLRRCPRGHLRMTRGRCGSLLLHRDGLAPSTPCRSPGALRSTPINGHRESGRHVSKVPQPDSSVRQVRTFPDLFLITELLDSKTESDDVGFEAELARMSCQIERAFRFVEVLKKAAADPSNRSSIDPPLFRLSRSGSNSCCQSSLSIVS